MQTSNAKQNFDPDDPVWVLLTELSLGDVLSDHVQSDNPTAGLLFQTARELGMSPECIESIAGTLAGFAKEVLMRRKQGGLKFPGWIRIFFQKKMIDDANATNTTSRACHTEQAMEHSPMILDFGPKINGGWGCFLIERGCNVSEDASLSSHHVVDLYLYTEG